LWQRVV
jgi:putative DNA-invertase from lambdoid prophage Rac